VLRGGGWFSNWYIFNARGCRSAFRNYANPDYRSSYIGFRVVFYP
jgi:formylglycine-generating enzyme required for sulfatase activity